MKSEEKKNEVKVQKDNLILNNTQISKMVNLT